MGICSDECESFRRGTYRHCTGKGKVGVVRTRDTGPGLTLAPRDPVREFCPKSSLQ